MIMDEKERKRVEAEEVMREKVRRQVMESLMGKQVEPKRRDSMDILESLNALDEKHNQRSSLAISEYSMVSNVVDMSMSLKKPKFTNKMA